MACGRGKGSRNGIELPLVPFQASWQYRMSQLTRPSTPSTGAGLFFPPAVDSCSVPAVNHFEDHSMHVVVITAPDCK
jgi:hypothetical protein